MSERIRVGIVGLGVGRSHAAAFAALPEYFELVGLCDVEEDRARLLAEDFDAPVATARFEALLDLPELDLIDICTPSYLHESQIKAALAAGKHVICEKPLVGSLREVDELAGAEARAGRRVMPIFQYRFGRGIQKLRYLVDQGVAGKAYLATVETHWRRRENYYAMPWRGRWATEMGGTLVTHAIHEHDLLMYVLGPVRSVFARAATRVQPIEVEDCAALSFEMADGSLVTSAVTVGSAEQISRLRFCFSHLTAESNTEPYNNSSEPWNITPDTPEAAEQIETALASFIPQPEGFMGQFLRYAEALRRGEELPVRLADARDAVELLTAIYASVLSGQPVELPIGRDHSLYDGWAPVMRAANKEGGHSRPAR
jgi:predicted dehydrogenase